MMIAESMQVMERGEASTPREVKLQVDPGCVPEKGFRVCSGLRSEPFDGLMGRLLNRSSCSPVALRVAMIVWCLVASITTISSAVKWVASYVMDQKHCPSECYGGMRMSPSPSLMHRMCSWTE